MRENYFIDTSPYLQHYGRLGMKWYQHIFGDDPRYGTNGRNSQNEGKSKASMLTRIKEHRARVKADKRRRAEEREDESFLKRTGRKIHAIDKEHAEKVKAKAMHSGDPRIIRKYMDLMSDAELNAAVKRAGDVKKLYDIESKLPKQLTPGQKMIKMLNGTAATMTSLGTAYSTNKQAIDTLAKAFGFSDDPNKPQVTIENTASKQTSSGGQGGGRKGMNWETRETSNSTKRTISGYRSDTSNYKPTHYDPITYNAKYGHYTTEKQRNNRKRFSAD